MTIPWCRYLIVLDLVGSVIKNYDLATLTLQSAIQPRHAYGNQFETMPKVATFDSLYSYLYVGAHLWKQRMLTMSTQASHRHAVNATIRGCSTNTSPCMDARMLDLNWCRLAWNCSCAGFNSSYDVIGYIDSGRIGVTDSYLNDLEIQLAAPIGSLDARLESAYASDVFYAAPDPVFSESGMVCCSDPHPSDAVVTENLVAASGHKPCV